MPPFRINNGIPVLELFTNPILKHSYATALTTSSVNVDTQHSVNSTVISPLTLGGVSVLNFACVLIFIPVNLKILLKFRQISIKDQPMFIFFGAVQCACIADLFICISETALFWPVDVPQYVCRAQGIVTLSIYCYLSIVIAFICIYRQGIFRSEVLELLARKFLLLKSSVSLSVRSFCSFL